MAIRRESVKSYTRYCYPLSNTAFLGVDWCGKFDCESDFYISRNNVDFFVFIYTVSGRGVIEINGAKYYAEKNTLAIVGGAEYAYYPFDSEWKFEFLHVKGQISTACVNEVIKKRGAVFPFFNESNHFESITNSIKNLEAESVISSGVYNLISSLIYGENFNTETNVITNVKTYVLNNLNGDLSVEKLASVAGLSRPYFSCYFLKNYGKSPSNYVIEERLKYARRLLYTTNKPISEIACLCGYYDVSSFIRLFKKHEGESPYKYRKNNPL